MRWSFLTSIFLAAFSMAQTPLTSNFMNYQVIDRFEISSDQISPYIFTSVKPYRRDDLALFSASIPNIHPGSVWSFNRTYLLIDNDEYANSEAALSDRPILHSFYVRKNALYSVQTSSTEDFRGRTLSLVVNPVLGLNYAYDARMEESLYRNSRGAIIRGNLGGKLGFYTFVQENQYRYPSFLRDQINTSDILPGAGLYKNFGNNGYDFFNAAGYISFSPIKEVMLQFGHDKNFIGNGYRSLILSDYAKEYPFLKLITQVWKIQYMTLFMEHIDYRATPDNEAFMRKYSALHHLSINIGQHLNIGLFENVIYDRHEDVEREGFDIQYLNPLIFYRAVEHGLNSTDNVVLGMDWKWNFLGRFSFYGQFVVDEFRKQDFFKQSSSWVNKWGYQLGLKYINVAGISHLDLQLELNQLRPYIYQHFTTSQNWIQFNQSLAHPLGANFREGIAIIRYQPLNRLFINFLFSASLQGKDSMNGIFNYGNDVTRDYENIPNKENVQLFQGTSSNIKSLDLTLSYMLFHNLFVDMRFYYRTASGNHYPQAIENLIIGGGLRLNTSLERWE